jgi:shikimate kinase
MLRDGSRAETLARLINERRPAYAEAHIRVTSEDGAHHEVVERIVAAIDRFLQEKM